MKKLKGRKPRKFDAQFAMLTYMQQDDCEWRAFDMICARRIKSGGKKAQCLPQSR